MILSLIAGTAVYVAGAFSTLKIWTLINKPVEVMKNRNEYYYHNEPPTEKSKIPSWELRENHWKSEGWAIKGWADSNNPYWKIKDAAKICLALWWFIDILVPLEWLFFGTKHGFKKLSAVFESAVIPKPKPELPAVPEPDKYQRLALKEVNAIAPEEP